MGYRVKTCPICGEAFQSTNNRQIWCINCKSQAVRNRNALWQKTHPDYLGDWRSKHPTANAVPFAIWCRTHPEARAVTRKKSNAKRRDLQFVPLNQPFSGCEAHHLNQDWVVYIPKALHHSVLHNVWTGQNMEQINALAFQWRAENS